MNQREKKETDRLFLVAAPAAGEADDESLNTVFYKPCRQNRGEQGGYFHPATTRQRFIVFQSQTLWCPHGILRLRQHVLIKHP